MAFVFLIRLDLVTLLLYLRSAHQESIPLPIYSSVMIALKATIALILRLCHRSALQELIKILLGKLIVKFVLLASIACMVRNL